MKEFFRYLLCFGFIFAGTMHFLEPAPFLAIYPAGWPLPEAAVALSGAVEIAGGCAFLWPQTQRVAAIVLILLLVAVYPANINMAVNHGRFAEFPLWLLWWRLPFQFFLIWAVWRLRR